MLHKSPSNPDKKWVYLFILPIIATAFMAFNKQEIIKYNSPDTLIFNDSLSKKMTVIIDKTTTNDELKSLKKSFSKNDVDFDYSKVKRNTNNELTSIAISIENKTSSGSYAVSGDKPIKPIHMMLDLINHEINIGMVPPRHPMNQHIRIQKDPQKEGNVFYFINDENNNRQWIERNSISADSIVIFNEDFDNIDYHFAKDRLHEKADKKIEIIKDSNGKMIYKVNDKEVSKEELDKMDAEEIIEVRIFKNDNIKEENINVNIDKNRKIIVIEGDDEGTAIYKVNGKELTKEEFEKLNPDDIEKFEIIKNDK